mgnify:CR=1 FL=1
MRIPRQPFFGVTSAFLYYMALVFGGKGVAELQEGGLVSTTIVQWGPRLPALGIYPTLESLSLQGVLLALFLFGVLWTFVIEPRRLRVTSVLVPDAPPAAPTAVSPPESPASVSYDIDMLRQPERLDADPAELWAEADRPKRRQKARRAPAIPRT